MSQIWEAVKTHTRRWSLGPIKTPTGSFPDEEHADPIRLKLGDALMVYENSEWRQDGGKVTTKAMKEVLERNRVLEGENQLLHFKLNVLLDMCAGNTLDTIQLHDELQIAKKK